MIRFLLVAMITLLTHSGVSFAQPDLEAILDEIWPDRPRHPAFIDPISPDSPNAAARYLWLSDRMDAPLADLAGWLPGDKLEFAFDPEFETPGTINDLRTKLIEQQAWITSLVEVTKLPKFDLAYASGFDAFMPQKDARRSVLKNVRKAARILRADAVRLCLDGKHSEAGDRLIAMFGLVVHFSNLPSPMINQLVAKSLLGLAHGTSVAILADGQPALADQQRVQLIAMLDRLQPKDPVRRREGWEEYRKACRKFAGEQLEGGEVGHPLVVMLTMHWGGERAMSRVFDGILKGAHPTPKPDDKETLAEAESYSSLLTHEALTAQLKRIDDLTERIKAVWEDADAPQKIKTMEAEFAEDATGLSKLVLVFPRQAQRDWRDSVTWVAELRTKLEAQSGTTKTP